MTSADGCSRRASGVDVGSLNDGLVLVFLGAREAGDPRAQLVGLRRGSSGIVWLPAAVCTTTVESPNTCSKSPRRVSTCWTRIHGTSVRRDRQRAVLDVDALVVDVPAPARPAQLRDAARRRARRRPAAGPGTTAAAAARHRRRPRRDRQRAPEQRAARASRPARATGRAALGGRRLMPARRRAARSRRARGRTRRRTAACVIGASVAASSRRRCARWAFTARARPAPRAPRRARSGDGRRGSRRAASSRRPSEKRSGHIAFITIASRPSPTASRSRRSSSIVSLTGISSGSATAT